MTEVIGAQRLAEMNVAFTRMTAAFSDLAIDLEYARVRRIWGRLPRHVRRRLSKDYALVRHYRTVRFRKAGR